MDAEEKEFAERGSRIIDSTHGAVSGNWYMIRVLTDCVFTVLNKKLNPETTGATKNAESCLTQTGTASNLSVKAGAIFTTSENNPFTDVTLSSGQVNAFNA